MRTNQARQASGAAWPSATIWKRALVAGALLFASLVGVSAQGRLLLKGVWPGPVSGSVTAVAVEGNRGYAAVQAGEETWALVLFDVTEPARPVRLGDCPMGAEPTDLIAAGNLVYMITQRKLSIGLDILDVSNPAFPYLRGRYPIGSLDSWGARVQVVGSYAFLSIPWVSVAVPGLLKIIDVSSPDAPVFVGQHTLQGVPSNLSASENYVYVAEEAADLVGVTNSFGGLEIFDVSNKSSPGRVGSYAIQPSGRAHDVQVVGSYAYLAGGTLEIVDVSDPAHPVRAGGYSEGAERIHISGTNAYLGGAFNKFGTEWQVLNLSNPTNPTFAAIIRVDDFASDLQIVGDRALIASGADGLQIFDVSNPTQPVPGSALEPVTVGQVYVEGPYVYAETDADLAILDVSNPIRPRRVGSYPGGHMFQVTADRGYVSGRFTENGTNTIEIVDMSNPTNLVLLGRYSTDLRIDRLQVLDHRAYISQLSSSPTNVFGLEVADFTDPGNPSRLSRFVTNDVVKELQVSGNYAFVADLTNDLRVLDIRVPASPVTIATYNSNREPRCVGCAMGSRSVALDGGYAYAAGMDEFHLLDVSDPTNPVSLYDYFAPFSIITVKVRDGYAGYAMTVDSAAGGPVDRSAIALSNIRNPLAPVGAGSLRGSGLASWFDMSGGWFYLGGGALRVYEIQQPRTLRIARAVDGNSLVLEWEGARGMRLEATPSPETEWQDWADVPGSDGRSRLTLPASAAHGFFRLAQP